MKILTAAQMQQIDRLTTEKHGVPSLTLMENAGRGVVEFLNQRFAPLGSQKILIVCGRGNNGGDGLVVARLLREQGLAPQVVLLADPASLKGDAGTNYQRLSATGAPAVVPDFPQWQAQKRNVAGATLIVDAILGTGLSRPVEGFLRDVILDLNHSFSGTRVVAVDLPSGIDADSGELIGDFLRADAAVTFTAPKMAHVFPPACGHMGECVVKNIGTPAEALENDPALFMNLTDRNDLAWLAARREREAHKGDFGKVLILAGSIGKTGAAALAAKAALRAGAGLVTVATAKSALPIIAGLGFEFMTEPLPETEAGTVSLHALDHGRLEKLLEDKSVLALGPGLGAVPETAELIRTVVNEAKIRLVLDADGLNAFAGRMKSFRLGRSEMSEVVMTPHPGEMARLVELPTAEIQTRRVEVARKFSMQYNVHLVLKGYHTLVAAPSGQVAVNPTGNPGMATGGTGDVLTGVMAGLLAQYPERSVAQVAAAAVYLHGLAGDVAARDLGEGSMIAGDLLSALPRARRALEEK